MGGKTARLVALKTQKAGEDLYGGEREKCHLEAMELRLRGAQPKG